MFSYFGRRKNIVSVRCEIVCVQKSTKIPGAFKKLKNHIFKSLLHHSLEEIFSFKNAFGLSVPLNLCSVLPMQYGKEIFFEKLPFLKVSFQEVNCNIFWNFLRNSRVKSTLFQNVFVFKFNVWFGRYKETNNDKIPRNFFFSFFIPNQCVNETPTHASKIYLFYNDRDDILMRLSWSF